MTEHFDMVKDRKKYDLRITLWYCPTCKHVPLPERHIVLQQEEFSQHYHRLEELSDRLQALAVNVNSTSKTKFHNALIPILQCPNCENRITITGIYSKTKGKIKYSAHCKCGYIQNNLLQKMTIAFSIEDLTLRMMNLMQDVTIIDWEHNGTHHINNTTKDTMSDDNHLQHKRNEKMAKLSQQQSILDVSPTRVTDIQVNSNNVPFINGQPQLQTGMYPPLNPGYNFHSSIFPKVENNIQKDSRQIVNTTLSFSQLCNQNAIRSEMEEKVVSILSIFDNNKLNTHLGMSRIQELVHGMLSNLFTLKNISPEGAAVKNYIVVPEDIKFIPKHASDESNEMEELNDKPSKVLRIGMNFVFDKQGHMNLTEEFRNAPTGIRFTLSYMCSYSQC